MAKYSRSASKDGEERPAPAQEAHAQERTGRQGRNGDEPQAGHRHRSLRGPRQGQEGAGQAQDGQKKKKTAKRKVAKRKTSRRKSA